MLANTRRRSARNLSPTVDGLEGRAMLSTLTPAVEIKHAPAVVAGGIIGRHIGVTVDAIQGNHIGGMSMVHSADELNP